MTNYDKLKEVLYEVFQMDQTELDFGIYRIMNVKRREITDFLDNQLRKEVQQIIADAGAGGSENLRQDLAQRIAAMKDNGLSQEAIDGLPKIKELRAQLASIEPYDLIEADVYSDLTNFLKRYYHEGDFISQRRYSRRDKYAIPYNGEEVKLHWANHDQYYIKSSEYLQNYEFKLDNTRRVRFRLTEADTEQNNNKAAAGKERRFRILESEPLTAEDGLLTLNFTYLPSEKKEKRRDIDERNAQIVREHLPADWAQLLLPRPGSDRSLLEYHLNNFTARNTFDYFIHKDLGGFLRRELDFFIKNEILLLDDIDYDNPPDFSRHLTKIRALRTLAGKVIDFLAQLEDFQKALWLKKKFVVASHYCITLDRIDEQFYPEIAANAEQLDEWNKLFHLHDAPADSDLFTGAAYSEPLSVEYLHDSPFLPLDTRFFSDDFTYRLLGTFEDLDAQTDGLLLNSENFQALQLLQERYREEVQCVYIDPPYNTGNDGFTYKDGYQNSSWITFVIDRVARSIDLLSDEGAFFSSIDSNQLFELKSILSRLNLADIGTVAVVNNPKGRVLDKSISTSHEYLLVNSKVHGHQLYGIPKSEAQIKKDYNLNDSGGDFRLLELRNTHREFNKETRPNLYYPFYVNEAGDVRLTNDEYFEAVYPDWSDGLKGCWTWGQKLAEEKIDLLISKEIKGVKKIYRKSYANEKGQVALRKPKSTWTSKEFQTDKGQKEFDNLFGERIFRSPKPPKYLEQIVQLGASNLNSTTLDYFAGSGTTAHAVINLNREDEGKRKYILVEMGEYFDTVTKPRVQKVIYSADWKDGRPTSRRGSSHCFQYLQLESYEDTLNNLRLEPLRERDEATELFQNEHFYAEYLLGYSLDHETRQSRLSVEDFARPFEYRLDITKNNETSARRVDLVTTFNFLIGLKVRTLRRTDSGYLLVRGTRRTGARTLVIWRNLSDDRAADDLVLNELFATLTPTDYDEIYVNGDTSLMKEREEGEQWTVLLLEEAFLERMFGGS